MLNYHDHHVQQGLALNYQIYLHFLGIRHH